MAPVATLGRHAEKLCETTAMGAVLLACGTVAFVAGTWRSYAAAREAVGPFVHAGEPTRTAVEATKPLVARPRIRLFARRVVTSMSWLAVGMYGLFLITSGLGAGA